VLGPAVNLVSRLEALAKQQNRPVLCSAAFAAALGEPARPLGRFPLRGFADAQEVLEPILAGS
jgi:adenylate cyclase